MAVSLQLIVTCTDRKLRDVSDALRLRSVRWGAQERRGQEWLDRLNGFSGTSCIARDLYAGDHWAVAREMPEAAKAAGVECTPWIVSAGYGLVSFDAPIHPYAATFATGQEDSVYRPGDGRVPDVRALWWHRLQQWKGPQPGAPRSLASLMERRPDTFLLIAASPPYIDAMQHDLRRALRHLDPDRAAIFCAGRTTVRGLDAVLVPCDSRLRQVDDLGGSMQSLNVRLARMALENWHRWELRTSKLREWFHTLLTQRERSPALNRDVMSDEEVKRFIEAELQKEPKLKHSPLLRRLRDSGRACEQSRFAKLFSEVKEATGG